ncbi:MAG TPA: glycosyltransferase [Candidatus Dormibacteraeota bacterium]|nr:glycosyltransferase [Candidatus Dormibacteraeota bacterium]
MLYAQDGKGMGHITRSLTIARHFLEVYRNSVAYIVSESPLVDEFSLPARCSYIKLPTHLAALPLPNTPEEDEAYNQHVSDYRAQILRKLALDLAPDLVLMDHEPFGHKGEFRDGLYALKAKCPNTRFVLGLRDIMDDIGRINAKWEALGVYAAFENLFDGIVVYGLRNLFDVAEAYLIPESAQLKLHYCGYVVREWKQASSEEVRLRYKLPLNGRLVVATVGGGRDGYFVLETAQAAFSRLRSKLANVCAVFVAGPFMSEEQRALLLSRCPPGSAVLPVADNFQLIGAADAVIGMGGYNSVWEALSRGRPLIIVPRATYKREQTIRAEMLASHGLARVVQPADLTGENLADALEWALSLNPVEIARKVREIIPDFNGVSNIISYLRRLMGEDLSYPTPREEIALAKVVR